MAIASEYFAKLLSLGKMGGLDRRNVKKAREWFRAAMSLVKKADGNAVMAANPERLSRDKRISGKDIGTMKLFFYDPKLKEVLPYYDRFPLIFPIGPAKGGFLGINMHYLDPLLRARLMDALYDTIKTEKDETKRLQINYGILKGAAKFKAFKPCIKHYLYAHVRSKYYTVPFAEWEMMLFLPTERFEKAGKSRVWRDSRKIAKQ